MKKLIENFKYDSVSFSYFRITFYSLILWFYAFRGRYVFNNWKVDPDFWDPISFYKLFSYSDLSAINLEMVYYVFVVSMACCIVGWKFRFFSILSFLSILFAAGYPCNFGKIHHSNHMPVVLLGLLCLVPAGHYSIDRLMSRSKEDKTPEVWRWIFFTILFYMSLVYFNAGFQKLRTSGWAWTDNESLATIILTRPTVTSLGIWVANSDWLPGVMAKFALLLELMTPLALFMRTPWRLLYGLSLAGLHHGMYLILGNHGAFFPYEICFVAWIPWEELSQFLNSGNVFKKLVPK